MSERLKYWLLSVFLAAISIAIGVALLTYVFGQLTFSEAIIVVVYPFALGYIISAHSTSRVVLRLADLQAELAQVADHLSSLSSGQNVVCHGTKYHVPNRDTFWNDLLEKARTEFVLVGNSNKSWINRDPEQSKRLGAAIVRIVESNGRVTIVSGNDPSTIQETENFLREHVLGCLATTSRRRRESLSRALKANLRYAVAPRVNYSAVVSDDRMLIIPRLNSENFNAEAMVLELRRDTHPTQFRHYHDDIERVVHQVGAHAINRDS